MDKSFVCNCMVQSRYGDSSKPFYIDKCGNLSVRLNGYVIMPIEEYYNKLSVLTIWGNSKLTDDLNRLMEGTKKTEKEIQEGVFP